MKIVFIFARKTAGETATPPVGIMSLAAVLRNYGYQDVKLFDMAYHSPAFISDICQKHQPDIIGLSSDSISFEQGVKCLAMVRHVCSRAIFILGGIHPTIAPEQSLHMTNASLAVIGEGEATIVDTVKAIEDGTDYSSVRGIAYRNGDQIVRTSPRGYIQDLDTIPFPARDLLPMEKYLAARPDLPMLYPTITLLASRGCKANCIYCQPVARTVFGRTMRHRTVENVIEEIIYLKTSFTFNNLYFVDDELLFNGREWIDLLLNSMIQRNLRVRWTCQARVDQVQDTALVALMRKAGCYAIGFGVESGSQKILNYMRKGYKAEMIDSAFALCRKHGIITTCNLMVGTPGETKETIRESAAMLNRVRPNLVRVSITTPTPGSDLYKAMKDENRIKVSNLSDFDRWQANPIRLDNFSRDDILQAIRLLLGTFYGNVLRLFFKPLRLAAEFFFWRTLMIRYCQMLRNPRLVIKDLFFYLNYFKFRKGY